MKTNGINIGETETGKIQYEINPEVQKSNVGHRSLNAKIYSAKHFVTLCLFTRFITLRIRNHKCALDGFSGKIVGYAAMARKKTLLIYEKVFRLMITFFIYKDNIFWISQTF